MVRGYFIGNTPYVPITIAWGNAVQRPTVLLDTGFTGDLQVTPQLAIQLGLHLQQPAATPVRSFDGTIIQVRIALALVSMEGTTRHVEVLITKGTPAIGISFLTKFGYRAIVDCKYRVVGLIRV